MLDCENSRVNHLKIQNFVFFIVLFSFLSYTNLKYFLLGLLALNFFFILHTQGIQKRLLLIWFWLVSLVFIAALVGVLRGNDSERILYEFYPVFFSLLGIIVVEKVRVLADIHKILSRINFCISLICLIVVLLYFFLIYKFGIEGLMIFEDYLKEFDLSFNFAGGGKIVTDYTPIILLILPYALMNRKFLLIVPIVIFILLSVSVTQYFCLSITLFLFVIRSSNLRQILVFIVVVIIALFVILTIVPELTGDFQSKFDNLTLQNKDPATSGLTSRVVQAEILVAEFVESPIFGKGLGYKSVKYNDLRRQWGDVPDRNLSMYENQYLDILMKFGLPIAIIIFFIYIILPFNYAFRGFRNIKIVMKETSLYSRALVPLTLGFFNFIIYVGSNGNQWYSPVSMFSWGLSIALLKNLSVIR